MRSGPGCNRTPNNNDALHPRSEGALRCQNRSASISTRTLGLLELRRGDYLICEGSWRGVVFLGREAKGDPIESQALELGRRKRRLRQLETRVIGLFARRQQLLRSEIENALGISRAATNRLLDRMAREGKILRSGKTKAARYELSQRTPVK